MNRHTWIGATLLAATAAGVTATPVQAQRKVTITPAVVTQFIAGLRAELAERDRLAAAPQTDANVKAFWHHRDRRLACDSLAAWREAEGVRAQHAMQTAENEAQMNAALARIQKLTEAQNKPCPMGAEPELVQSFFDNLRVAESGMDDVGANAAGLQRAQYAQLRERIAALILRGNNPMYRETVGYTPAEVAAVKARAGVLKQLLARDFDGSGARKPNSEY